MRDGVENNGCYLQWMCLCGADAESQCGEAMDACVMLCSHCDQMQRRAAWNYGLRYCECDLRGTHGQRREREPVPGVHVARLYDYCV